MNRENRDPWGLEWWKLYSGSKGDLPEKVGEKWIGEGVVKLRRHWEGKERGTIEELKRGTSDILGSSHKGAGGSSFCTKDAVCVYRG